MPALSKPFPERWWYGKPSSRSEPHSFRLLRATDEFCNSTLYIGIPFLGDLTIRWRPGPIRTEACGYCQREFGPWCNRCQSCHEGPRCHPLPCWPDDDHQTAEWGHCPICAGWYCKDCEPEPRETCPDKEKA